jgi:hypothetical protein
VRVTAAEGRMGTLVDVFVGNYPEIDWDLYSLWVEVASPLALETDSCRRA